MTERERRKDVDFDAMGWDKEGNAPRNQIERTTDEQIERKDFILLEKQLDKSSHQEIK